MAAAVSEAKPRQLQVARLLQEEEESWISSEELHTDGSSDEDCAKGSGRSLYSTLPASQLTLAAQSPYGLGARNARRGLLFTAPPPATASEPATQDAPHLTETTRRLSELGIEETSSATSSGAAGSHREDTLQDEMEEQEDIMLWRPKRGSLKLPQLDLSRLQQAQLGSAASDAARTAPIPESCDGSAVTSCPCTTSHTKKPHNRVKERRKCNCKIDGNLKARSESVVQCAKPEGVTDDSVEVRSVPPTTVEEKQPRMVEDQELESDDGGT